MRLRVLDSKHKRSLARGRLLDRTRELLDGLVALSTKVVVIAGGGTVLVTLLLLIVAAGRGDGVAGARPAGSGFALAVSRACDATNRSNRSAAHRIAQLKQTVQTARTPIEVKGAVLHTLDALANGATDIVTILAAATPPDAAAHDRGVAVAALQRNIARVDDYEHQLDIALTPAQVGAAIQATSGMKTAIANDRALLRTSLLKLDARDCRLAPQRTVAVVFAPPFYTRVTSPPAPSQHVAPSLPTQTQQEASNDPERQQSMIARQQLGHTHAQPQPASKVPRNTTPTGTTPPSVPMPVIASE